MGSETESEEAQKLADTILRGLGFDKYPIEYSAKVEATHNVSDPAGRASEKKSSESRRRLQNEFHSIHRSAKVFQVGLHFRCGDERSFMNQVCDDQAWLC